MPPNRTVYHYTDGAQNYDLGQEFAANGKMSGVENIPCAKKGCALND